MTKVTRQRKPAVAAQVAALPTTPLATAALAAQVDTPAAAAAVVVARSPAKPAIKPQAPAAAAAKPAKAGKHHGKKAEAAEPKPAEESRPKAKLVRDSFTMPKAEYELLAVLKQRGTQLQRHVKKSELLRAGIAALHSMSDKNFLLALDRAPSLKTGRPKADAAADDSAEG